MSHQTYCCSLSAISSNMIHFYEPGDLEACICLRNNTIYHFLRDWWLGELQQVLQQYIQHDHVDYDIKLTRGYLKVTMIIKMQAYCCSLDTIWVTLVPCWWPWRTWGSATLLSGLSVVLQFDMYMDDSWQTPPLSFMGHSTRVCKRKAFTKHYSHSIACCQNNHTCWWNRLLFCYPLIHYINK